MSGVIWANTRPLPSYLITARKIWWADQSTLRLSKGQRKSAVVPTTGFYDARTGLKAMHIPLESDHERRWSRSSAPYWRKRSRTAEPVPEQDPASVRWLPGHSCFRTIHHYLIFLSPINRGTPSRAVLAIMKLLASKASRTFHPQFRPPLPPFSRSTRTVSARGIIHVHYRIKAYLEAGPEGSNPWPRLSTHNNKPRLHGPDCDQLILSNWWTESIEVH